MTVPELADEFWVDIPEFDCSPSYNIPPFSNIVALLNDGMKRLALLKWGFTPRWAKDSSRGGIINARAESVRDKPVFRNSFLRRRIIIPASGFYEWKKESGRKVPYYIHPAGAKFFGLAGIYDLLTRPDGISVRTCAIITTSANSKIKEIHDRMPVILNRKDYYIWIDPDEKDAESLLEMTKPLAPDETAFHRVSPRVNSPSADSPEYIREV